MPLLLSGELGSSLVRNLFHFGLPGAAWRLVAGDRCEMVPFCVSGSLCHSVLGSQSSVGCDRGMMCTHIGVLLLIVTNVPYQTFAARECNQESESVHFELVTGKVIWRKQNCTLLTFLLLHFKLLGCFLIFRENYFILVYSSF